MTKLIASDGETSFGYVSNRANADFDVANLILKFLPSKDGVVLRRLLVTAVSTYDLDPSPLECRITIRIMINIIPFFQKKRSIIPFGVL